MDELDVKIFRTLVSESAISPSNPQIRMSLRAIATRLGVDDMTVNYRYKRLQELGWMSVWQLIVNPTFFGCKLLDLMVDVQPEAAKEDMIRKLKLVQGVVVLQNFYGRALKVLVMYNNDDSRSRMVELVSRITNAELVVQSRMALPASRTDRLTETDIAVIRALGKDARRSTVSVAKELKLSTKTVRNRVDRLRKDNTIFTIPSLNISGIRGLIPVLLSYSYSSVEAKHSVDREMLSHFESSYLYGGFSDPERGQIMLSAPTATDLQKVLDWAKSQHGIASARADIPTEQFSFPERVSELLETRSKTGSVTEQRALLKVS
jgi:DNA-binding Lrp family transcriptional regulator